MAPDTMQIRLHLRLIRVLSVLVDSVDDLVVAVHCTRSWSRCPHCGFACRRVHDTRRRRVRDLSVSGRPVTLVWHRRRFSCDSCAERHLEDHNEFGKEVDDQGPHLVRSTADETSRRSTISMTDRRNTVPPRSYRRYRRLRPCGRDFHLIENAETASVPSDSPVRR